jgi:hypothetical protein
MGHGSFRKKTLLRTPCQKASSTAHFVSTLNTHQQCCARLPGLFVCLRVDGFRRWSSGLAAPATHAKNSHRRPLPWQLSIYPTRLYKHTYVCFNVPVGLSWLGSHFNHEVGASPGWMVRAESGKAAAGTAAVKVRKKERTPAGVLATWVALSQASSGWKVRAARRHSS